MVMHAHLTLPGRPAGRATVVDQVAREQTRFRGVSRPHDCHLDRCHSHLYKHTCISDPVGFGLIRYLQCADGEIMTYLLPNMTEGSVVVYNRTVQSKYFNWEAADGSTHQVWYDDPDTLLAKYSLAKGSGVRGLGVWGAGAPLDDPTLAKAMWDAIPTPRKDPRWP